MDAGSQEASLEVLAGFVCGRNVDSISECLRTDGNGAADGGTGANAESEELCCCAVGPVARTGHDACTLRLRSRQPYNVESIRMLFVPRMAIL